MRSSDKMLKLLVDIAVKDERIRAVTMEGSRASKDATHDRYCDFDICYVVQDVRPFTNDPKWIGIFGEILMVQLPMDWYSHPYDYAGHSNFTYLIQLKDGNRIDLTLIDVQNISKEADRREPRIVLLNKDNFKELKQIDDESIFHIQKPSEMEFRNTCNEFRWLSLYVSKGLCREELYYAKYAYDVLMMEMFIKMLNWKIGTDHAFCVTTGKHSKYLKRFLLPEEMERFQGIFPDGSYTDIWSKLFAVYDYFAETAKYVAQKQGYCFDAEETDDVRLFLMERQAQCVHTAQNGNTL